MKILAIETSCDETAICLLEATETLDGIRFSVLGNVTHSQIDIHREYGGVFPALAKREHQKNLPIVLEPVMRGSPSYVGGGQGVVPPIDYICVTSGPGLEPALWTGIVFAQELGKKWSIPVVPVNHMEGHLLSFLVPNEVQSFTVSGTEAMFPSLALLVSGGHTELVVAQGIGDYTIIGKTLDDAVGEAFDKVARMMGLPYPGGPEISKLAAIGRARNVFKRANFPRPMIHSKNYDFSFSGLKTAVLYFIKHQTENPAAIDTKLPLSEEAMQDIAREFEEAAIETLVSKTKRAVEEFGIQTLVIGGGVAANTYLREKIYEEIPLDPNHIKFPTRELATDNALMIALAGYFKIQKNPDADYGEIRADGNWSL